VVLTNGITYRDNLKGQVISLTFLAGETTKVAKWDINQRPTAVYIAQVLKTNGSLPTNQITVSWRMTNEGVEIKLYNLEASTEYNATFIGQV
tara:strand:+ start:1698 stop:1973 length:276 start_codon:yes stop_codon:yes gene_type:complete